MDAASSRAATGERPNTRIAYMYRDGGNYKQFHEVVAAGTLTFREVEAYLFDGYGFIAGDIGLPDLQLTWELEGYEFPTQEDVVICELEEDGLEPTADPPTTVTTAADILSRLRAIGGRWDFAAAERRMGFGGTPVEPAGTRVVRVRAAGHDGWCALAEVPADTAGEELFRAARRVACIDAPVNLFLSRPDLLVEDAVGEPDVRLRHTTTGKWHRVAEDFAAAGC